MLTVLPQPPEHWDYEAVRVCVGRGCWTRGLVHSRQVLYHLVIFLAQRVLFVRGVSSQAESELSLLKHSPWISIIWTCPVQSALVGNLHCCQVLACPWWHIVLVCCYASLQVLDQCRGCGRKGMSCFEILQELLKKNSFLVWQHSQIPGTLGSDSQPALAVVPPPHSFKIGTYAFPLEF